MPKNTANLLYHNNLTIAKKIFKYTSNPLCALSERNAV